MTEQQFFSKYGNQLIEIAAYAKQIKFDIETGDFSDLIEGWFRDSMAFYTEMSENKTPKAKAIRKMIFEDVCKWHGVKF